MKVYLVEVKKCDYDCLPYIMRVFETFDKAVDFIESNFSFLSGKFSYDSGETYHTGYFNDGEALYDDGKGGVYYLVDGDRCDVYDQHTVEILEMDVL